MTAALADASDTERLARVALSRLVEPGDHRVASLVAELGATRLRELLVETPEASGLRTDVQSRLPSLDPERDLDQAARLGIRFVIPGDDEWPERLDDLLRIEILQEKVGPPLGLWVKGPLRLDQLTESVAVVGSRSSTTYGDDVAAAIGATLAASGRPVVSGAAFGIDVAAHRGALSMEGPTVAVLACGADRDYPLAHHALLRHLASTCAVVSELPPGCAPTRGRFLSRNRLIAAITRGTVVVEAAVRSGALNTANWASRLNRPLMGVPGPVTSGPSQGVHQLVRSGAATLVTSGAEVLEVVGGAGTHLLETPRAPERARDGLPRRVGQVLDAVPLASPAAVDSIAAAAGMGLVEVSSALNGLHGRGLVERLPSGWRLTPAAQT